MASNTVKTRRKRQLRRLRAGRRRKRRQARRSTVTPEELFRRPRRRTGQGETPSERRR